ncbi:ATP/GTP-binding protein [Jatrophihabitans fulvus]
MPRKNARRTAHARSLGSGSVQTSERFAGETYTVRSVSGQSATKAYRCPGCAQLIPPGTPHVVVWPYGDLDAADRRHWHRACWSARDRRTAR